MVNEIILYYDAWSKKHQIRVIVFVAGLPSCGTKHVLSHISVVTHFTIRTYDSMLPAPLKTCLELMGLQTVTNKELREESDVPALLSEFK